MWTRVVAIEADGSFTSPTATLAEGDYTVRVTRTDLAGNVGSVTRALAVDTTAPSPAAPHPPRTRPSGIARPSRAPRVRWPATPER